MKNKMITLLISTVLFLSVFYIPLGAKHASAASIEGIVTASTLNVHEKASASSKKIGSLKKGTSVIIAKQQSSWSQITYKSKTGWVSNKYISIKKTITVTKASTTTKYYVTTNSLNIRKSATASSKVVATVHKGASVTYYSKSGNWAKVKTASSITGWVNMAYLSTTKPIITKTYYVTSDTLNVRTSGNASAKKLTTIYKGESVTYYSKSGNWGKIKTKSGITGWVNMYYLSTTKPTTDLNVKTVSNTITTGLTDKVIVLDPGHGGKDPGAIGENNNEKDLTLSTAKILKAKLEAAGAIVIMTRTGDTYPSLSERAKISNNNDADVFISLHYNAGSSTANGIETYYSTSHENEKELASYVQEEVIKSTGLKSRGVKTADFTVIYANNNQAILVELGFISNPDEENIIETNSFQNKAATGIVNGLEAYFDSL